MKNAVVTLLSVFVLSVQSLSYAQDNAAFDIWLTALRQEAVDTGYSAEAIDLAFSEIKAPVPRIVSNDRNQAEVVQTYNDYLGARVSDWKVRNGKRLMQEHEAVLQEIAEKYKVQARFIVAIWGMETNFGTYPIREPVFASLATLAFDARRAEFYRGQFFDALTILDSGFPAYDKMKSSWAGAMGQSQFMPENYLRFAVDYDGDGKKDIWDTPADVFASIANYLSSFGWSDDQTWGREVKLPSSDENALRENDFNKLAAATNCARYSRMGSWHDLQHWQAMGVRTASGADLPTRNIPAALLTGDSGDTQGFIVYKNFCSIMRYNPAFKYALSIGLLSDLVKPD